MVGKTHSGKTTFGYELEKKIKKGIVIQTDPISKFLKQNSWSILDKDKEHDGSFVRPSLKIKIFETILRHALENNFIPILSNANMHQKLRNKIIELVHKKGYKVIGVYLDFTEDFLLKRIKETQRDTIALNTAKTFEEALFKQRNWFVPPDKKEFDFFFTVSYEKDLCVVKKNIINLTAKNLSI